MDDELRESLVKNTSLKFFRVDCSYQSLVQILRGLKANPQPKLQSFFPYLLRNENISDAQLQGLGELCMQVLEANPTIMRCLCQPSVDGMDQLTRHRRANRSISASVSLGRSLAPRVLEYWNEREHMFLVLRATCSEAQIGMTGMITTILRVTTDHSFGFE